MADFSQSIASRKRAHETDESESDPADHAHIAVKKKKKSQKAVAPTYSQSDPSTQLMISVSFCLPDFSC